MATQLLNTTWNVGASFNGGSSNYTFRLEVILETQDIANNKSRITVNKYVKGNSGNSWYGTACTDTFSGAITDSFSYNPARQSGDVGPMRNTEVMYHTYTTTSTTDIEHEPDGSKTISITTKFTNGGNTWAPNTNEKTFNVTLPTIARASTLTASSSYTISNTTGSFSYTVTSAAAFYHRLIWNLNGNTTLNLGLINATSASFTIANSALLAKIPSATSGTLTLTLRTYSDSGYSTQIGSDVVKTVSLSVGADIKPSVTIGSIVLDSGGFNGNVLAGKSTVKVASWSVSLVGSATLPTNGVTISGLRVTPTATSSSSTSGSITSNTLTASASDYTITFTVTATDSRGRSGSATTAAFTVKGYSAPTALITAYRVASSSSSTRDDTGAYLYAGYTSAVGSSFSGANTISTTVWRYTVGSTNTNLSANPSRVALSQENSATVTLSVKDTVGTTTTVTATVNAAVFPIDMYDDGEGTVGVGLGGIAIEGYIKPYLPIIDVEQCFHVTDTGEDLDDYKTTGIYYFDSSHTPTNIPIGVNGWLMVMKSPSSGAVKQMWWRQGTNGTNDFNTYVRQYSASAWSSWVKLLTASDTVSNATNADNADAITPQLDNPTSSSTRYIPFLTGTSASRIPYVNDGLKYLTLEGTTSANGYGILRLGNTIDTGTAGNKYGLLDLYPKTGAYYGRFTTVTSLTANRTYTFPNASGTVLLQAANNYVSLFSGTISSSATSTTFTGANYSAYCIVGAEGRGYRSSTTIPRSLITTTAQQFMVTFYGTSSIENVRFTLQATAATGGTITLTWQSGKTVTQVFGIK